MRKMPVKKGVIPFSNEIIFSVKSNLQFAYDGLSKNHSGYGKSLLVNARSAIDNDLSNKHIRNQGTITNHSEPCLWKFKRLLTFLIA